MTQLREHDFTPVRQDHYCVDGWICEEHAESGWPHKGDRYYTAGSGKFTEECPGPGMPCRFLGCKDSMAKVTA